MISWLAACAHQGVEGWGVVQRDHDAFATRIPGASVAPGEDVIAWQWPDTRDWTRASAAAPPPVRQSKLRPVTLEVASVDGDTVRFRVPADLDPDATLVTRLRRE